MKKAILFIAIATLAAGCRTDKPAETVPSQPVPQVILDMDLGSSTDDIICMDLLFGYQAEGRADILGIICDRMGGQNAVVADIYRTFYGRPSLPLGLERNGVVDPVVFNRYAPLLDTLRDSSGSLMFPRQLSDGNDAPDGCAVYRQLLARADNRSVDIISCGFVTTLANLLQSQPDEYSPLSGVELVRQKVKKLYIMCGVFYTAEEPDFNLSQAPAWSKIFFDLWPKETPVLFNPMEVGQDLDYRTEWVLADIGWTDIHPTKQIYLRNSADTGQRMWDVVSLLYLMEDTSLFEVSEPGWVSANPDWTMQFTPDADGRQQYIKPLKPENAEKLMDLMRARLRRH